MTVTGLILSSQKIKLRSKREKRVETGYVNMEDTNKNKPAFMARL